MARKQRSKCRSSDCDQEKTGGNDTGQPMDQKIGKWKKERETNSITMSTPIGDDNRVRQARAHRSVPASEISLSPWRKLAPLRVHGTHGTDCFPCERQDSMSRLSIRERKRGCIKLIASPLDGNSVAWVEGPVGEGTGERALVQWAHGPWVTGAQLMNERASRQQSCWQFALNRRHSRHRPKGTVINWQTDVEKRVRIGNNQSNCRKWEREREGCRVSLYPFPYWRKQFVQCLCQLTPQSFLALLSLSQNS